MSAETVYKVSTIILWILILMNSWSLWRNIRTRKALRRLFSDVEAVEGALREELESLIESNSELRELRERAMEDD